MENEEFCKSIDDATTKILNQLVTNMKKACLLIVRDAKKNCDTDHGHLRASISSDVKSLPTEITGKIFSNLDYAPYKEKGTGVYAEDGDGRKTPWLVPAKNYKGSKRPTFQGKVVIVYGKGGNIFYKTDGIKPKPFLEPARDKNKDEVLLILGGKK